MAKQTLNRLPSKKIMTLPPGRHADGGNLYLVVGNAGARSWLFMYRWQGKQRELGLGSARDVSLADARKIAAEHRALIAQGLEPARKRRDQSKSGPISFGTLADATIAAMSPGWREGGRSQEQWTQSLRDHAASLRDMPIAAIDTEAVLAVLTPLWAKHRDTANRVRNRIERILDAGKAKGLRSGENPARWRGHLDQLLPRRQRLEKSHHAALDYADMPAFTARLRKCAGVTPKALQFTILCAARRDEVISMQWNEIDFDRALWTIPGSRMKGGKEHVVPLSDAALAILRDMLVLTDPCHATPHPAEPYRADPHSAMPRRPNMGFIFRGSNGAERLAACMPLQLVKELAPGATLHGFRSSFRDWCGDCTEFSREIVEAALAHAIGNATEAAYRRATALAKRRALMQAWSDYCCQQPATNVVPLKARQG